MESNQNKETDPKNPPPLPPRRISKTKIINNLNNNLSLEESIHSPTEHYIQNLSSNGSSVSDSNSQSTPTQLQTIEFNSTFKSSSSSETKQVDMQDENLDQSESPTTVPSQIPPNIIPDSSSYLELNPDEAIKEPLNSSQELKQEEEREEEIEELEVDEFLRRSSKYIDQVEICQSTETTLRPIPKISQFRLKNGNNLSSIDWIGFFDALLLSQLERYCPNSLRSSPPPTHVSISQVRAQATRSYVTLFSEFQRFSLNQITTIYRWENPRRTAFYLSVYYGLWFTDLIPAFIVSYLLYFLIGRRLNPPTVSQLKQEVNKRHQLGKQVEVIDSEGSIAKALLSNSMAFASAAVGVNPRISTNPTPSTPSTSNKSSAHLPPPKVGSYRGLYTLGRGIYNDYGAEIQFLLADLADLGEKFRNLYLWRRPHACWRTTFMLTGILVYTLLVSQKWIVKNFLGWLGIEFFLLIKFAEKNPEFRKILNPIWIILYEIPTDSEFALEILQKRAKLNKINSPKTKKKNISHLCNHSISSSIKSISKRDSSEIQEKSHISGLRSVLEPDNLKHLGHKVIKGSNGAMKLVKRVYEGEEKTQSKVQSSNQLDSNLPNPSTNMNSTSSTKLKTFATLCGKVPGNLVVDKEEVSFEPLKGFRTMTCNIRSNLGLGSNSMKDPMKRISQLSTSSSSNSIVDQEEDGSSLFLSNDNKALNHQEKHIESNFDSDDFQHSKESSDVHLIIPLNLILKIKKIKKSLFFGVGFRVSDGIEFQLTNSSAVSFDNIINRDLFFNQLVTICHIIDK